MFSFQDVDLRRKHSMNTPKRLETVHIFTELFSCKFIVHIFSQEFQFITWATFLQITSGKFVLWVVNVTQDICIVDYISIYFFFNCITWWLHKEVAIGNGAWCDNCLARYLVNKTLLCGVAVIWTRTVCDVCVVDPKIFAVLCYSEPS